MTPPETTVENRKSGSRKTALGPSFAGEPMVIKTTASQIVFMNDHSPSGKGSGRVSLFSAAARFTTKCQRSCISWLGVASVCRRSGGIGDRGHCTRARIEPELTQFQALIVVLPVEVLEAIQEEWDPNVRDAVSVRVGVDVEQVL